MDSAYRSDYSRLSCLLEHTKMLVDATAIRKKFYIEVLRPYFIIVALPWNFYRQKPEYEKLCGEEGEIRNCAGRRVKLVILKCLQKTKNYIC